MHPLHALPLEPEACEDDEAPVTLRSPTSSLQAKDHAVSVDLEEPLPPRRRELQSGVFAIALALAMDEERPESIDIDCDSWRPTRRLGGQ